MVERIDREGLMHLLEKTEDTTYVVNFWATWCSPCVEELPYFQELQNSFSDRKLQVVLVSLDFPNQLERRVTPFLETHGIDLPVYLMTDMDYDSWISKVDPTWSGAIPATLFYNRSERAFFEKAFEKDALFRQTEQMQIWR